MLRTDPVETAFEEEGATEFLVARRCVALCAPDRDELNSASLTAARPDGLCSATRTKPQPDHGTHSGQRVSYFPTPNKTWTALRLLEPFAN